jgi:predicted nuclease of predicted toxin-antitoxin system
VRPLDFALLTDENIAADVVAGLRTRGCDVRSADEERLIGRGDGDVLERATVLRRVILTHDLAFGKVDIRGGAKFVGIVYLRPGHISAPFILAIIDALRESSIEVQPPFMGA